MPLVYWSGFDTAKIGTFAVVVGGTFSGTATVTASTYSHIALTSVTGAGTYAALAAAVQTALQTVNAGFTCTFNSTTRQYTIAHASAFTLTWSGTNLRDALGFSANVSSTTSAVSTRLPYYVIVASTEGRSQFTDVYEPPDLVEEAVADSGLPYSVSREFDEDGGQYCDWQQTMEAKAAVLVRSAASASPWTYQHLWRHARGDQPFLVAGDVSGSTGIVYRLRAEGASFTAATRLRVTADYDGLWSLQFMTRDFGVLP